MQVHVCFLRISSKIQRTNQRSSSSWMELEKRKRNTLCDNIELKMGIFFQSVFKIRLLDSSSSKTACFIEHQSDGQHFANVTNNKNATNEILRLVLNNINKFRINDKLGIFPHKIKLLFACIVHGSPNARNIFESRD